MTEYFRITGKNNILFDAGATGNYLFTQGEPPEKLSTILTRREVLLLLPQIPLGVRPSALQHGLSVITMEFNIQGTSDTDMEAKEHDLIETLVETELFFSSLGDMGTRAVLTVKSDGAVATSYKSVFYGVVDELDARDVLGAIIRAHRLEGLRLTLYCEPHWRPEDAVELGPNEIQTPSFEEDGNADGLADHWVKVAPGTVCAIENTIVLHGCDSQKITTDAAIEGILSATMVAPLGVTEAVAYIWVCRPAAGADIRVVLTDNTVPVNRDTQDLSTGGWQTEVVGGNTWHRIVVSSNAIVPGNDHVLQVYVLAADPTVFYVDEAMWIWGTLVAPDEWIGHYTVWNHYDAACDTHLDHVNYLDIDRLKGDVDSRLRIEMQSLYADTYGPSEFTVARRTDPCLPCEFEHFLEAENASVLVNWPVLAPFATKSGCGAVFDGGVNTAGHVIWDYATLGYNLACQKGRFRALGVVYAHYTDAVVDDNIKFRATVGMTAAYQQSRWVQPLIADRWHWVDFGVFEVTGQFWGNELPATLYWRVDYQKEANDDVYLDFLLLLPEDESILRILLGDNYLATKDYTAATIAFAATTPGTITDTAAGLAPFLTGDIIVVSGSASNDGTYTVSTGGVAGTIRTVEPTVLEALGATITIASYEDVLWDNTFDFIHAMKRSYQDTFVYHPPVQAEPLALAPDEENRLIFAMGHYFSAALPYKGNIVHEDNGEHMTVLMKYLPQFVSPLE